MMIILLSGAKGTSLDQFKFLLEGLSHEEMNLLIPSSRTAILIGKVRLAEDFLNTKSWENWPWNKFTVGPSEIPKHLLDALTLPTLGTSQYQDHEEKGFVNVPIDQVLSLVPKRIKKLVVWNASFSPKDVSVQLR